MAWHRTWPLGEIPHQLSPERCRQHLPEAGSLEAFLEEEAELSLKGNEGRVGQGAWGREERQGSKQSLRPFPRDAGPRNFSSSVRAREGTRAPAVTAVALQGFKRPQPMFRPPGSHRTSELARVGARH